MLTPPISPASSSVNDSATSWPGRTSAWSVTSATSPGRPRRPEPARRVIRSLRRTRPAVLSS